MIAEIPAELCDIAVDAFVKEEPIDAGVHEGAVVEHRVRNTTIRFIPDAHWMTGVLNHVGRQANMFHGWNFNIDSSQLIQFATYEPGQHYDWHIDTFILSGQPIDRKISVVCLLNDPQEFEGGVFEFRDGTVPLKKGSIIVFPSFHEHRVTPVTSGIRKSATLWLTGPAFR